MGTELSDAATWARLNARTRVAVWEAGEEDPDSVVDTGRLLLSLAASRGSIASAVLAAERIDLVAFAGLHAEVIALLMLPVLALAGRWLRPNLADARRPRLWQQINWPPLALGIALLPVAIARPETTDAFAALIATTRAVLPLPALDSGILIPLGLIVGVGWGLARFRPWSARSAWMLADYIWPATGRAERLIFGLWGAPLVAVSNELIFRWSGPALLMLVTHSPLAAWGVPLLLFAVAHADRTIRSLPVPALFALTMTALVIVEGGLISAIVAHAVCDLVVVVVLPEIVRARRLRRLRQTLAEIRTA